MIQRHFLSMLFSASGLGIVFFLAGPSAHAQRPKPDSQRTVWSYYDRRDAGFLGGQKALIEFLRQHVRYPAEAAKAGITGKVFVSFLINTAGHISDITILKGLGYGCDEEAIRVVNIMPRWQPGTESGRSIRVKYNLPVLFGIDYPQLRRG